MKVGYLVNEFPVLSQTFVLDEVKGHLENGIDITVLSLAPVAKNNPAQANLLGLHLRVINIFRMRRRKLRALEKVLAALRELATQRRLRPILFDRTVGGWDDRLTAIGLARAFRRNPAVAGLDLLHCHFGPNGRYAAILNQYGVFDGPVLTTFHAYELTSLLRQRGPRFYDTLFRFGAFFLPISAFWIPTLVELGCDPASIKVHRMGIDCHWLEYVERSTEAGMPVRLISTGRLMEKKGHIYTLRALALLKQRHPDLSLTLDVVGDGPEETNLKSETTRLGLGGIVTFHGGLAHRHTLDLLRNASIFVLPSVTAADGDMEGIPVALMEAMALGLPVVSTVHSGIPELVDDRVSGRLVPERNVEALAEAIFATIADPERCRHYARAGRKKIEMEFNRPVLTVRLEQIYRKLLGNGHARKDAESRCPPGERSED